ncbi:MAG: hypothetical protein RR235_09070 [Oscillospiraceae bacterium]
MKKVTAIGLLLIANLLLSSCGTAPPAKDSATPKEDATKPPAPSSWASEGRAYKQTAAVIPGSFTSVFAEDDDYYAITVFMDMDGTRYELIKNGTKTLYSVTKGNIIAANCNSKGIWMAETFVSDEGYYDRLCLLSFEGEILSTFRISDITGDESSVDGICCTDDAVYLLSGKDVLALNNSAELTARLKADSNGSELVSGGDGNVYLVCPVGGGLDVSVIEEKISPVFSVSGTHARIFEGNDEFPLIMATTRGLYGLQTDGEKESIIIWDDCGIGTSTIISVISLPAHSFLLADTSAVSLLKETSPEEMSTKTTLVLATVGGGSGIKGHVANFNATSSEYYIAFKDYSEDGSVDTATAMTRLNADIISGSYPDLLLFEAISPFIYINKGYLMDIGGLLQNDPDIGIEDIAIAKQLTIGDGIYVISNSFGIDTRVGLYSNFGDVSGWTLKQYLEAEKNIAADAEIMYNTTKQSFLRTLSSGYSVNAVDWTAKTCDFDNDAFIEILEAGNRIKETPEPESMSDFDMTPGYVKLAEGTRYTNAFWIGDVWALADLEKKVGSPLSVIGAPTVDGSNGSDIWLNCPIGVFSKTQNADGCLAFIKYILQNYRLDSAMFLPVYTPYLKMKIDKALNAEPESGERISKAEAERFMDILNSTEQVAIYDEVVLGIIEAEAARYFEGDSNAHETAKSIQSKVSLYVAEQG